MAPWLIMDLKKSQKKTNAGDDVVKAESELLMIKESFDSDAMGNSQSGA